MTATVTKRIQGKRKEPDYCGCCGREADAGEWCSECKEHINPRKTLWDATYFAQHGIHCPFQREELKIR
jgi:hypothetical protein